MLYGNGCDQIRTSKGCTNWLKMRSIICRTVFCRLQNQSRMKNDFYRKEDLFLWNPIYMFQYRFRQILLILYALRENIIPGLRIAMISLQNNKSSFRCFFTGESILLTGENGIFAGENNHGQVFWTIICTLGCVKKIQRLLKNRSKTIVALDQENKLDIYL